MEEMTDCIVTNWNSVIKPNDNIYVLGDMFWTTAAALEVLPQLQGNIFLLRGNHDRLTSKMEKYFVSVKDYACIKDNDHTVILQHYPVAHWDKQSQGSIHLFGHIHANTRDSRPFIYYKQYCLSLGIPFNAYNVGCMLPYMAYTPRTLDYIIQYNGYVMP
jgi:calcineurin-like phosphoesterase family protein